MRIFKFLTNRFRLFRVLSEVCTPTIFFANHKFICDSQYEAVVVVVVRPPLYPITLQQSTAIVMEMEPIDVLRVCSSTIYMCDICTRTEKSSTKTKVAIWFLTQKHFTVKSLPIECHALRILLLCYRMVRCGVV